MYLTIQWTLDFITSSIAVIRANHFEFNPSVDTVDLEALWMSGESTVLCPFNIKIGIVHLTNDGEMKKNPLSLTLIADSRWPALKSKGSAEWRFMGSNLGMGYLMARMLWIHLTTWSYRNTLWYRFIGFLKESFVKSKLVTVLSLFLWYHRETTP